MGFPLILGQLPRAVSLDYDFAKKQFILSAGTKNVHLPKTYFCDRTVRDFAALVKREFSICFDSLPTEEAVGLFDSFLLYQAETDTELTAVLLFRGPKNRYLTAKICHYTKITSLLSDAREETTQHTVRFPAESPDDVYAYVLQEVSRQSGINLSTQNCRTASEYDAWKQAPSRLHPAFVDFYYWAKISQTEAQQVLRALFGTDPVLLTALTDLAETSPLHFVYELWQNVFRFLHGVDARNDCVRFETAFCPEIGQKLIERAKCLIVRKTVENNSAFVIFESCIDTTPFKGSDGFACVDFITVLAMMLIKTEYPALSAVRGNLYLDGIEAFHLPFEVQSTIKDQSYLYHMFIR